MKIKVNIIYVHVRTRDLKDNFVAMPDLLSSSSSYLTWYKIAKTTRHSLWLSSWKEVLIANLKRISRRKEADYKIVEKGINFNWHFW